VKNARSASAGGNGSNALGGRVDFGDNHYDDF
jgi:hypothetical protein